MSAQVLAFNAIESARLGSIAKTREQQRQQLREENPGLSSPGGKLSSHACAAKNIRAELARAFPGVKFSVTAKSYSGGSSIRVGWTDGPQAGPVESIACRYKYGHFDGMSDCYEHSGDQFPECFGGVSYVFCGREYSDKAMASAIRYVVGRFGPIKGSESPTVEDWRGNRSYSFWETESGHCLRDRIGEAMHRQHWATPAKRATKA